MKVKLADVLCDLYNNKITEKTSFINEKRRYTVCPTNKVILVAELPNNNVENIFTYNQNDIKYMLDEKVVKEPIYMDFVHAYEEWKNGKTPCRKREDGSLIPLVINSFRDTNHSMPVFNVQDVECKKWFVKEEKRYTE
jgi:hypothetical protein